MSSIYESLREFLLKLGPTHPLLRSAIRLQARASGFKVASSEQQLVVSKGARRMLLPINHYAIVPSVVHMWDLLFDTVAPETQGETAVLDLSRPGLHEYIKSGVSLWSPGVVEEDSLDAYTAGYHPRPGDVVRDIGAHAGATAYFFQRWSVPPEGSMRSSLMSARTSICCVVSSCRKWRTSFQ